MTTTPPPAAPHTSAAATSVSAQTSARWSVFSPRVFLLLVLGFSSGLPLALVGHTLSAWMTDAKVDLTTVGLFSAVMLPYSVKFLWAPAVDQLRPPVLGRRRGWALVFQLALMACLLWMAATDPIADASTMALAAVCVAAFSASQDIVLDAYRTDVLAPAQRAAGSATFITGYRLGMLASGSLAFILADHIAWPSVYRAMAAFVLIGVVAVLLAPEPPGTIASTTNTTWRARLQSMVVLPLRDFTQREGAATALAFMLTYKIGDAFAGTVTTPFFKGIGFTNTELGTLHSGAGMIATIVGGLVAGAVMPRLGVRRGLLAFGALQALTNVFFALMALTGKSMLLLVAGVVLDNFAGGMGTMAFVSFLMGLCDRRFSATQYALFSSVSAFPARALGAFAGAAATSLGWSTFFFATIAVAVPGVLLVFALPSSLTQVPLQDEPQ
jgi:PAT family beta-lactamase induction signal transducer AmpG